MPAVKAWIVAIEKYAQQFGGSAPEDQLDIPVAVGRWALDLAEFLVETAKVPKENLVLNLSLSAREEYGERLKKLGVKLCGATEAELRDSLKRLKGRADETLLVYWVGHGIRDDEHRYLLCADSSSPDNLVALTADSLLRHFRSNGFPGRQMGFFEACAQRFQRPVALDFPEIEPVAPQQFYFYAASANEVAPADLDGPGFSSEVLKHLKASGQIPQDPKAFFMELDQAFDDLHSVGLLRNRPFDLQYTKGSGDQWSRTGYQHGDRVPIRSESIYLYDRGPQVRALEDLIQETPNRANRPLAFVVSGPDREYHEALHERLSQIPLPKRLLGRGVKGNRLHCLLLPEEAAKDEARTVQSVKTYLEDALEGSGSSILDTLPNGLTYFRARLRVDKKLGRSATLLRALLGLLNDAAFFPDLPDSKAVCVGISVDWEAIGPSRRALEKQFPETDFSMLRFRVLPDLDSPRQKDAKRWTELLDTLKPGLLSPTKWDALGRLAEGLFDDTKTMPMRDLGDKFTKLFP